MNNKGFSLIEVGTVVIIIGTLAAIGLSSYRKAVEKSEMRSAETQLKSLHGAANIYFARHRIYWPTAESTTPTIARVNQIYGINLDSTIFTTITFSGTDRSGLTAQLSAGGGTPSAAMSLKHPISAVNPYCSTGSGNFSLQSCYSGDGNGSGIDVPTDIQSVVNTGAGGGDATPTFSMNDPNAVFTGVSSSDVLAYYQHAVDQYDATLDSAWQDAASRAESELINRGVSY